MKRLIKKNLKVVLKLTGLLFLLISLLTLLKIEKPNVKDVSAVTSPTAITKKVLVLNFDPYISGTTPLTTSRGWYNPVTLQNQYVTDIRNSSHNYVNYSIVSTQTIRDYPYKPSGFKFTNSQYVGCLTDSSPAYCGQIIDYNRLITDYNICTQVNSGTIDEVWLWGGPWFGYWEAVMAGPNAHYTNASPITGTTCTRSVHIMGFSYERGNSEMLENFGHRTEGTMRQVYGGTQVNQNTAWNRFSLYNKVLPGKASCGSVHYAYNSLSDYDWSNQTSVANRCDDFLNYPSTKGATVTGNCSAWGCTSYGYIKYWLSHLPTKTGLTNNKLNNWWAYAVDYDNAIQLPTYGEKWYAVEAGGNDYYTSCGQTVTGGNEIYLGVNPGCTTNNLHTGYFNFTNVQVPRGAFITDAFFEFVTDGPYDVALNENITVSDGTTTSSAVSWPINTHWDYYTVQRTPNIKSAVQSLVNSASWASGKTITLKVSHVSGSGQRRIFGFEREGNAGARLVLVTSATGPTATPTPSPRPTVTVTPTPNPVVNLYPTADSYISSVSSDKNRNFGSSTTLKVDGSPVNTTYMKYDLTSIASKIITRAVLRLRVTDGSTNTQNIKSTSTSWSEGSITYSNRPALSTLITSFVGGSAGTWKEIDITSYVNSNKGRVVSFGIDSTGGDNLNFYSRNATSGNRPYIEVR